jgi:hypothetical protein
LGRGPWAVEGIYSGCKGWVHAPPPPLATPSNFLRKSIFFPYLFEISLFFTSLSCRALCAHRFGDKKNKAVIAMAMQAFCTPSITKNVFTRLRCSPTSKMLSTSISHATHYESQEAPLRVLQVSDGNGSQRLLTLPGRV